jgi:hypothetical protein
MEELPEEAWVDTERKSARERERARETKGISGTLSLGSVYPIKQGEIRRTVSIQEL